MPALEPERGGSSSGPLTGVKPLLASVSFSFCIVILVFRGATAGSAAGVLSPRSASFQQQFASLTRKSINDQLQQFLKVVFWSRLLLLFSIPTFLFLCLSRWADFHFRLGRRLEKCDGAWGILSLRTAFPSHISLLCLVFHFRKTSASDWAMPLKEKMI